VIRRRRPEPGTYVYLAVAVAVLAGLGIAALGAWRVGITVGGVAIGLAGVVRGVLPERVAGLLRIRRRSSDVLLMVAFGAALVTLPWLVPTPPG